MADQEKPGDKGEVIYLPDNRCPLSDQDSDRPFTKISEADSVVPTDDFFLAKAERHLREADLIIRDIHNRTLDIVKEIGKEIGHLEEDQIEFESETGHYFIKADNGKRMTLREYLKYIVEEHIDEEIAKRKGKSIQDTVD